jgi:CheY-like chemotaxis protein
MKLLIIAGPYEADRIRKAAIAAGFETLAVEPGESLSGWITASRPDLIVMAPQIVHPDPALALAKVRTVPRGRVPVFLVGDAAEEDRMRNLAEGFFVRPIAPEILLAQARAILTPAPKPGRALPDFERTEMGLGAPRPPRPQQDFERTEMGLGTGVPVPVPRDGQALKPLVAAALAGAPVAAARGTDPSRLLAELGAGIDALLDADLQAIVAAAPRRKQAEFGGELTRKADPDLMADAARAAQKKRAAKKPPRTSPGMPVPAVAPPAADDPRARLLRRHAVVQDADYFAVLGLSPAASDDDIRRAHAALVRETAAAAEDEGLARELADQIADIRTVADEALRILTDQRLRPRYAAHLGR